MRRRSALGDRSAKGRGITPRPSIHPTSQNRNSRKFTSRIARSYAAKPGRADLRTMGDATRDCPPFPSMVVSKHMLSAKKTPICGIYKVDQSVTARYNFVVEPGLPVSPLQGGPALQPVEIRLCSSKRGHRPLT